MIAAPATLGLLGGGQLGRYFVLAAQQLGYRVVVVDPQPDCPAAGVADVHLVAAYDDPAALVRLVAECAAVTTEFENVPADALRWLAAHRPVRPSAEAVGVCQNRLVEKRFLVEHGFPLAPFAATLATPDKRGKTVGTVMSGLLLGILLARTVAGSLAALGSWRTVYWVGAMAMVAMAAILYRALPRRGQDRLGVGPSPGLVQGKEILDHPGLARGRQGRKGGRLLQHRMGVGAAHAEAVHRRPPRPSGTHHSPRAGSRKDRHHRPFRRFHPRLSGRGPRHAKPACRRTAPADDRDRAGPDLCHRHRARNLVAARSGPWRQ